MWNRLFIAVSALAALVPVLSAQQPCESLGGLKLTHTQIVSASLVAAGPFSANDGLGNTPPVTVPARCVIKAVARPTSDSEIHFEVWLPAAGWNGKYEQVGNGGWAGMIPTGAMIDPLRRGYATAGTDDGHAAGGGASWAVGHPEKLIDFGYRAVHETNLQAQAIIQAFYGKDTSLSYFVGCSDGGREGLMEAQRYPEEFVGIIAGAPASYWSHLLTGFVWNEQALMKDAASGIPAAKLPAIQNAVLAQCDGLDGVKDGLVEDPRACHFNPRELLCNGADSNTCLTAPQIETLKKIYAGPKNPRTGEQIFPGYPPGTEAVRGTWGAWIIPASPQGPSIQSGFGNSYYGQVVFERAEWDFRSLNFDSDVAFGDQKAGRILNAVSPDLRTFRAQGGKLIQYHGWGDAAISPLSSIEYYERVGAFLAENPDPRSTSRAQPDFYRLFMVPGMGHCGGGAGPNNFGNGAAAVSTDPDHDILSALERWVEKGIAPDRLIGSGTAASGASTKLTRPLCPYPQVARYMGSGDPNDASSFACAAPVNPR